MFIRSNIFMRITLLIIAFIVWPCVIIFSNNASYAQSKDQGTMSKWNSDAINANNINQDITEDTLISREILFGNPDRVSVKISPNGLYISFMAPKDGVLNVCIAPIDNLDNAQFVTNSTGRPIAGYNWSFNNKQILYYQDSAGDENYNIASVDIKSLEHKILTPKAKIKAHLLKMSEKFSDEILIMTNERIAEYFDVYRINIVTGAQELIFQNDANYIGFVANDELKLKFAKKMLPTGEQEIYQLSEDHNPTLFKKVAVEDMLTTGISHISKDGSKLFLIDSYGRNTSALFEIDLNTSKSKMIFSDPRADVSSIFVDLKTYNVQAVASEYMIQEWSIIDQNIAKIFEYFKTIHNGDGNVSVISKTINDDQWILALQKSDSPIQYYLFDVQNLKAKFLFSSNSKQDTIKFSKLHSVEIQSRDSKTLVSYLSVPRWLDSGNGVPSKPVPLILYVHGGPNARDSWGCYSTIQWLNNRGYAVLCVNYRGSTGFGKDFINAGDGEWSGAMQRDLEDGIKWAIDNNITTKDQVVIMGGSYGGYAALVGATMTPDLYVAAIDIVGISNLNSFWKSIPPYWKPHQAHLIKMLGADPDTVKGEAFLAKKSPITYVNNIKKPLMIVQGANDPRVNQEESEQIVSAMQQHSIPVLYLLYSDEGHGLRRPKNRVSMYLMIERFLAQFVGGRRFVEENENFDGSSIDIRAGNDILTIK